MIEVALTIEGFPGVPYSQSRAIQSPKKKNESHDDYEMRVWREKCTTSAEGNICIPGKAIMDALVAAAKHVGDQIPGRGKKQYSSCVEKGIIVDPLYPLTVGGKPLALADAKGEKFFCHSSGKKGSGTRVWRCFPMIYGWAAEIALYVVDEIITEDAFRRFAEVSGLLIGIGRFRPENGGLNGRYRVTAFSWKDATP